MFVFIAYLNFFFLISLKHFVNPVVETVLYKFWFVIIADCILSDLKTYIGANRLWLWVHDDELLLSKCGLWV